MYALIARLSDVVRVISSYAIPKAVGRGTSGSQLPRNLSRCIKELWGGAEVILGE